MKITRILSHSIQKVLLCTPLSTMFTFVFEHHSIIYKPSPSVTFTPSPPYTHTSFSARLHHLVSHPIKECSFIHQQKQNYALDLANHTPVFPLIISGIAKMSSKFNPFSQCLYHPFTNLINIVPFPFMSVILSNTVSGQFVSSLRVKHLDLLMNIIFHPATNILNNKHEFNFMLFLLPQLACQSAMPDYQKP